MKADKEKITFENSLFFFLKTSFSEEWSQLSEIRVVQVKGSIYTIIIMKDMIKIRTFIRGSKTTIEEIAKKLSDLGGVKASQTD
jgi:hypothetical protein